MSSDSEGPSNPSPWKKVGIVLLFTFLGLALVILLLFGVCIAMLK